MLILIHCLFQDGYLQGVEVLIDSKNNFKKIKLILVWNCWCRIRTGRNLFKKEKKKEEAVIENLREKFELGMVKLRRFVSKPTWIWWNVVS